MFGKIYISVALSACSLGHLACNSLLPPLLVFNTCSALCSCFWSLIPPEPMLQILDFISLHTSYQTDLQTHKWLNYKVPIEIIFATIVVTKYTLTPAARNCGNQNLSLPLRSPVTKFFFCTWSPACVLFDCFLYFSRFVCKLQFKK
jgi:hypothetical protein